MIVVTVQGHGDSGKTRALQLLILKIIKEYFPQDVFIGEKDLYELKSTGKLLNSKGKPKDITVIVEIGDIKIGITTKGDTEECLRKAFEWFEAKDCDIAVCACHLELTQTAKYLRENYDNVTYVSKNKVNGSQEEQERDSEKVCNDIFDELQKILPVFKNTTINTTPEIL